MEAEGHRAGQSREEDISVDPLWFICFAFLRSILIWAVLFAVVLREEGPKQIDTDLVVDCASISWLSVHIGSARYG